jgi:hypothetical protein
MIISHTRFRQTERAPSRTFGGMTDRRELMQFIKRASLTERRLQGDEVQPDISDLELRISKAAELAAHAVKALYSPSF